MLGCRLLRCGAGRVDGRWGDRCGLGQGGAARPLRYPLRERFDGRGGAHGRGRDLNLGRRLWVPGCLLGGCAVPIARCRGDRGGCLGLSRGARGRGGRLLGWRNGGPGSGRGGEPWLRWRVDARGDRGRGRHGSGVVAGLSLRARGGACLGGCRGGHGRGGWLGHGGGDRVSGRNRNGASANSVARSRPGRSFGVLRPGRCASACSGNGGVSRRDLLGPGRGSGSA